MEQVKKANGLISSWVSSQDHLTFINVFPATLGRNSQPRPEFFLPDRLHMNARGYALCDRDYWALFEVITRRCENRSTRMTRNRSLNGVVFAIFDIRVGHRAVGRIGGEALNPNGLTG